MLCARPAAEIGTALANQFQCQIRPAAMNLGEIKAEESVKRLAHVKRQRIRLPGPVAGFGQRRCGGRRRGARLR